MELAVMVEGQEDVTWPDWCAIASACEANGIAALFRSDHLLPLDGGVGRGVLDAWGTVCGLAASTATLRLGTLVSPVTFRHPAVLAKLAVTADQISGGRIELGIGAGWFEREHSAYGLPFPTERDRFDLLEEQVVVINGLLTPGFFEHDGQHYRLMGVDAMPKPSAAGGIPLILGGVVGPRSARIAARYAREYNTAFATAPECRRRRALLDDACQEAGRDPRSLRFSVMTGLVIGQTTHAVRDRRRRVAERLRAQDFVVPFSWVSGTPGQVLEQLRALEAVGVDRVMLQIRLHEQLDQLSLLGEVARALDGAGQV